MRWRWQTYRRRDQAPQDALCRSSRLARHLIPALRPRGVHLHVDSAGNRGRLVDPADCRVTFDLDHDLDVSDLRVHALLLSCRRELVRAPYAQHVQCRYARLCRPAEVEDGSGRGVCDETHVPTATTTRVAYTATGAGGNHPPHVAAQQPACPIVLSFSPAIFDLNVLTFTMPTLSPRASPNTMCRTGSPRR